MADFLIFYIEMDDRMQQIDDIVIVLVIIIDLEKKNKVYFYKMKQLLTWNTT